MASFSLGIRQKNPFNIRRSSSCWLGLSASQSSEYFCSFIDFEYGIRAGLYLLTKYRFVYGLKSIDSILSRWAPPTENDTLSYIRFVKAYARLTNDINTINDLYCLAHAMCLIESGYFLRYPMFEMSFSLLPNKFKKLWKK